MTPGELTAVTALASSALTAFASLGVAWLRDTRREKAAGRAELQTAMEELLARSASVAARTQVIREITMRRSGRARL